MTTVNFRFKIVVRTGRAAGAGVCGSAPPPGLTGPFLAASRIGSQTNSAEGHPAVSPTRFQFDARFFETPRRSDSGGRQIRQVRVSAAERIRIPATSEA
jgi:hypothetical protein